ncbi:septal ring lytic transglycosylase RlpA family protein [Consotaella salsifontis]|uniref:Endolytic peptidoglycan transglycosylase RlpA n=1 Tax=Consotaella salsifontis TaxID=1365950 RepID=A0A1T4LXQ7_9HYPH|nr:septal ring lytic transglycosylase RlpA family protein [Consotaella salsifontis]SJZ59298.1 rare lipoprotein A [Consotaella salsifontis]
MTLAAKRLARDLGSVLLPLIALVSIGGCQAEAPVETAEQAPIATAVKFDAKTYGVPASPRVTSLLAVRKGGGRTTVGKPYRVRGRWYYPKEDPNYSKVGTASWYGPNFHGRLTANGEVYDMNSLSGAHPTFPLPSYARVTNEENGRSIVVRINDRGPFAHGRLVDLSSRVADMLDFKSVGTAKVKLDYIGRAPTDGDDSAMLMASYRPGPEVPAVPDSVMVASNAPATAASEDDAPTLLAAYAPPSVVALPRARPLDALNALAHARPLEATFDAEAEAAVPASLPARAPIPQPRDLMVSAFAAQPEIDGAARAVTALAGTEGDGALASRGDQIVVGVVDDPQLRQVIGEIAQPYGRLIEEPLANGSVALSIDCAAGENSDRLLQALWTVGATDAFVVHEVAG